MINAVSSVDKV